jgi:hypothetical protein
MKLSTQARKIADGPIAWSKTDEHFDQVKFEAHRRRYAARQVLLVVLASMSLALCDCVVLAAQIGEKVLYKSETRFASDARHGIDAFAGARTIIVFDTGGVPMMVGFAYEERGEDVVQGQYGVDGTGKPKNDGRLIYRGSAMPYVVTGAKDICTYHLSYLELTTVKDAEGAYRAYAIKAIASDNKVETLGGGISTYKLPEGRQFVIDHGKIRIGDKYVTPNYDCSGKATAVKAVDGLPWVRVITIAGVVLLTFGTIVYFTARRYKLHPVSH